jgi:hypothetical protein
MLLLSAACWGDGDPSNCFDHTAGDADAAALVNDTLLGTRDGTWKWLETMKTTTVTVTIAAADPVTTYSHPVANGACPGPVITLDVSVQTGDGLVGPSKSSSSTASVDPDGGLAITSLDLEFDPASLLAGGAAPEEPNLASQHPLADLRLDRAANGALQGGTLTVTSRETSVTLATLTF